jgi:hypothetical protein
LQLILGFYTPRATAVLEIVLICVMEGVRPRALGISSSISLVQIGITCTCKEFRELA